MRKAVSSLLLLVATAFTLAWFTPSQSHTEPVFTPTPTVSPTLPACVEEDGSGQALCYWDAQVQGNGLGTSVVSGDCAPDVVGGDKVSALCVKAYARKSHTITNDDGSMNTIPNGADLVRECGEYNSEMTYSEKLENGWTMENCIEAQMNW